MPHLKGPKLAHPVMSNKNFTKSLLIGTDHYWDLVQDNIVRGKEPTAQESRLGYLLSGRLPCSLSQSAASIVIYSNIQRAQLEVLICGIHWY